MKYAVVGAGAMGLRYGLLLQEVAGKSVDFVEPTKESIDKIKGQGNLVYQSRDHEDKHPVLVNIYSPEEYTGEPDVWIFFMKQMQLAETLERMAPHFKDNQVAVGAMNGMGHIEKLQSYFKDDKIIGGTAMIATILNDFGDVDFIGKANSGASAYSNLSGEETEATKEVMEDFQAAHLNPTYSNNFMGTLLTKVFFNAVENSIATMFQARMGNLLSYDQFVPTIAKPLVDEAYDAAAAAGITLLETREEMLVQVDYVAREVVPLHFPSMYQDFVKNRPTEVDYINGWIADLAEANGVAAPTQRFITNLVHLAEAMREFNPPVNQLAQ
ncbi:ketopantoate reductase family protein [Fructobacillus fructosus]|uniref:2-dehydropantoate 2-reductase n=1 Tax=Fructobacillus fructosus TaxID=1631 RepID=A0ABN9YLN0_9LACO|nr:ketopantoate reductase family protein [Fructobacillus fructosus]MBC9118734.1 ketopantoate reductase family protein [Fructobacillus fructosus]MBD9365398.1 ketopantoate reductase family protein [Leuconostoc mesenteroides]MCK8637900.1 ketopantoate reductase family protein [Fructobacillus fructosus]CAK1231297.1 Ketopantoate reductase (PanE) [Fructobacillus fructosus]